MRQNGANWLLNSDTSAAAVSLLCALLLVGKPVFAQKNLVPNGGFDILELCPNNFGQIVLAAPWQKDQGTPDLFHECSLAPDYRVPQPFLCQNLPAHNGQGYAGITVFGTREFLTTSLSEPLQGGKPYYVRFFAAADKDCKGGPQSFSDAISLMLKRTNDPTGNFETVLENSSQAIKATSWVKISDCYYARGTERELRIGNPKTDDESIYETDQPDYPYPENYMFVDDVFLGTFDPFPDTLLLCEGVPTILDATFLESEYQWNTGATGAVLVTSDTGRFVVQATMDGCVFRDTVQVINLPPTNSTALNDTTLCDSESLMLAAPIPGKYRWSNGSTAPQIVVKKIGEYSVTVTNECGEFHFSQKVEAENCRCRVFVPNVFSPNDDGYNDVLEISIGCEHDFTVEQFEIFDRWGGQVFVSKNYPLAVWDGKIKGKKATPGVYVWHLTYSLNRTGTLQKIVEQGDITLLR